MVVVSRRSNSSRRSSSSTGSSSSSSSLISVRLLPTDWMLAKLHAFNRNNRTKFAKVAEVLIGRSFGEEKISSPHSQ